MRIHDCAGYECRIYALCLINTNIQKMFLLSIEVLNILNINYLGHTRVGDGDRRFEMIRVCRQMMFTRHLIKFNFS